MALVNGSLGQWKKRVSSWGDHSSGQDTPLDLSAQVCLAQNKKVGSLLNSHTSEANES